MTALLALTLLAGQPPAVWVMDTTGAAPFTVHAHALGDRAETPGATLTDRVEWDFGDPGGDFDRLVGFNAAHVYDHPGTYTLELTRTGADGDQVTATVEIVVAAPERELVFVSPLGDDGRDGSSPMHAVRSLARAARLMGHDTELRLARGGTYPVSSTLVVPWRNVVIGAWGEGADPVLMYADGRPTTASIVQVSPAAADVVIQDLAFDSPALPSNAIVRAITASGRNLTVRRCRFGAVSYAVRAVGRPAGVLTVGNTAGVLGAYYVFGEGSDHCHVGNTVAGSADEHNMRFYADRVLVAHNDLANQSKRTIWCVDGSWASIVDNRLSSGPVMLGPRPQDPGRWTYALLERNRLLGGQLILRHGTEHVLAHSNAIRVTGGVAVDIWGHSTKRNRTCVDVRFVNNTVVTEAVRGRCISVGEKTADTLVANNMYAAPNLETGSQAAANAYVLDEDLGTARFSGNLWAEPAATGWGDGWHYVWPYWSDAMGYRDPAEWAALPGTTDERYRRFGPRDLDADFVPQFDARVSTAVPGVHVDLRGRPRPLAGTVTAGAVEQ